MEEQKVGVARRIGGSGRRADEMTKRGVGEDGCEEGGGEGEEETAKKQMTSQPCSPIMKLLEK